MAQTRASTLCIYIFYLFAFSIIKKKDTFVRSQMLRPLQDSRASKLKMAWLSTGILWFAPVQTSAQGLQASDTRPVVHRINCGGLTLEDNMGRTWAEDYGYRNSSTIHRAHGSVEGLPLQIWEDFQFYEQQRCVNVIAVNMSRPLLYM